MVVRDNVVDLPVVTKLDLDPDRVLRKLEGKLSRFVLVGYDKEDQEFLSSTIADGPEVLWLLERAKMQLLNIVD